MIKFINQIDNLLNEIIKNDKLLIILYDEHCQNSKKLISIINSYDLDIDIEIILINKHELLQKNYNKLEKHYFNYYLQNNSTQTYYNNYYNIILSNISFLTYNNLIDLETPHFFFIKKSKNLVPTILHHSTYYANFDYSNNFVKLLNNFSKKNFKQNISIITKKHINVYVLEQLDIRIPIEEIQKIQIFI